MKKILLSMAVLATISTSAQNLADFESPAFGVVDSAWYGQDQQTDGDTIYFNDGLSFELSYNAMWGSFSGFAVSSWTDNMTPGWSNQYSAMPAMGADSSDQYGICFVSQWSNNRMFVDNPFGSQFLSLEVTNTAYAYYSMLNGDAFGKPFGADTAANGQIDGTNGEDWFILTIYALGADSLHTGDSVNVYLADYTFADDSLDYIVDEWISVDISALNVGQYAYGLDFVLSSSDTSGGFGMNTPSYFAIDNVRLDLLESVPENTQKNIAVYPNPTSGQLNIMIQPNSRVQLYDMNGRLVKETISTSSQLIWNIAEIESGIYTLVAFTDGERRQTKVIKQ